MMKLKLTRSTKVMDLNLSPALSICHASYTPLNSFIHMVEEGVWPSNLSLILEQGHITVVWDFKGGQCPL